MNLPEDFETYTRQLFGDDLYSTFRQALDEEPPVSIRVNPFKLQTSNFKLQSKCNHKLQTSNFKLQSQCNHKLQTSNFKLQIKEVQSVPWCPTGLYLTDRPAFTFDPLLHAGLYYVQEASSMFITEVARQLFHEPMMMLDLCAAPGGKTTALRSVLPEGSLLFTNEPVKTRASILKENVEKWGHPDVIVTNNYPRDYKKSKLTFDAILADVPCSGEGMFRKDPDTIKEWSRQNVEKCWQLQRSIIEDIWPSLRPGGILIYSTCTYNAHEDEENVKWIMEELGAKSLTLNLPMAPSQGDGKSSSLNNGLPLQSPWGPGYRFIPGITRGEGLYMAVLQKNGDADSSAVAASCASHHHNGIEKSKHQTNQKISHTNQLIGDFTYIEEKGFVRAIPTRWVDIYNKVKSSLHVIHAGVGIGTVKGKDIVPDASLALSIALNKEAYPEAELTYEDAIKYLRKEAITLDASMPKGFTIVTYKGCPLGFVKNLGNRANNLYPQEWRIKSSYIPEGITSPLLQEGLGEAL